MLLPQQIQAILYHLLMGWLYGCTFSFLCSLTMYSRSNLVKGFVESLYHVAFILLSFYGLYQINGGVTNIYLLVFFLLGIFIYYSLYLPVFMEGFTWFKRLFIPIKKFYVILKSAIIKNLKLKSKAMKKKKAQKKRIKREKRLLRKGKEAEE